MTEAQTTKNNIYPISRKREIDWAQFLDFTRFIEAGEIGNDDLEKFKNDLTQ